MNELIVPFKVNLKIGKTRGKNYPLGDIIIQAKYRSGLALGLFLCSFKIFFMGIKKLIE